MAPRIPVLRLFDTHEPQIRFVHQGRRVECLPGGLMGQTKGSQFSQLIINEREDLSGSGRITLLDLRQEMRNLAHVR